MPRTVNNPKSARKALFKSVVALCLLLTVTPFIGSPASAQVEAAGVEAAQVDAAAVANPKILIVGDSITSGLGNNAIHAQSLNTYRAPLQALLDGVSTNYDFVGPRTTGTVDFSTPGDGKQNYDDFAFAAPGAFDDFEHAGQPGYNTADILNGFWGNKGKIGDWATAQAADIVLIHIGTVDVLLQFTDLSDSADNVRAMIDAVRAARPNADIVLATMGTLTPPGGVDYSARITTWNSFINSIATEKDTADSRVVVANNFTGYEASWNYDGIMPDSIGQSHIANAFFQAMNSAGMVDNAEPAAAFTTSCTGLSCTFDATTSNDTDGTVSTFAWKFGDGTTATGATPAAHAYSGGGSFTVELVVTDNDGAQDSVTSANVVSGSNQSPTASFTVDCTAGFSCDFDASASADTDGTIASYAWTFGDTRTGTGKMATNAYATFGTFTVTLTVTDNLGATSAMNMAVTNNPTCRNGYWLLESDGDVYAFGNAQDHAVPTGSGAAAIDIQSTPNGCGYWIVRADGTITAVGGAAALGNFNIGGLDAGERLLTISTTASGNGLWGFTSKGRTLTLGDAVNYGGMIGTTLNGEIIDSIATSTGLGYFMLGSDGGIFTFGDAVFINSLPALVGALNEPAVGLVPDPDGNGYWIVAADGGVFSIEAPYRGSFPGLKLGPLNKPGIGMVPYGNGYLIVATDGGVFTFSNLKFEGSLGANPPNTDIVAITPLP
jgi:PKD repeat protein